MVASGWARSSRSGSSASVTSTTSKVLMSGSCPSGHGTRTRMTVRVARSTTVVSSVVEERTRRWSVDPPAVGTRSLRRAERRSRREGSVGVFEERSVDGNAVRPGRAVVGRRRGRVCRAGQDRCRARCTASLSSSGSAWPVASALPAAAPGAGAGTRHVRAHPTRASNWAGQRHGVGGRRAARASLADVGQPGFGRAPLEQGAVVGFAPGDDGGGEPAPAHLGEQVRPVARHHDLVAPAPHGERRHQIGERRRVLVEEGPGQGDRCAPRPRRRLGSSANALARSRAATAMELVAGTAPSRNSLGRTTSASASAPVVKNPPDVSSQNRSTSWDGRVDAPAPARVPCPSTRTGAAQASASQAWSAPTARWRALPPCQLRISRPSEYMEAHRNSDDLLGPPTVVVQAGGRGDLRQRGRGHGVPLGQHLFVPRRLHPLGPGRGEEDPGLLDLGRSLERRADGTHRDGPPLPVAPLRDAVPLGGRSDQSGGEQLPQLVEGEGGVAALDPSGVGVEGGVERALRRRQVAQHEIERLGHHAADSRRGPCPATRADRPGPGAPGR